VTAATAKPPTAGAPPAPKPPSFDATVDPQTGDLVLPPAAPGAPPNPFASFFPQMSSVMSGFAPDSTPVSIREYAGAVVLAALEKRGGR
jgi:hypothetical protein